MILNVTLYIYIDIFIYIYKNTFLWNNISLMTDVYEQVTISVSYINKTDY